MTYDYTSSHLIQKKEKMAMFSYNHVVLPATMLHCLQLWIEKVHIVKQGEQM